MNPAFLSRILRMRFLVIFSALAILLGAAAIQLAYIQNPDIPLLSGPALARRLPETVYGARVHDEPVADTDEMKRKVKELLNYDDAIYRIYEWPDLRVSVYAGLWRPGVMSPRLVATHTPDVCWPGNGWVREPKAELMHGNLANILQRTGFNEAERRIFTMKDRPEYVVFWHRVGSEYFSYGNGSSPPWWAFLDEIWRYGTNLRQAQLFVRVSADRPLETFWEEQRFMAVRDALLRLGLERAVPMVSTDAKAHP